MSHSSSGIINAARPRNMVIIDFAHNDNQTPADTHLTTNYQAAGLTTIRDHGRQISQPLKVVIL